MVSLEILSKSQAEQFIKKEMKEVEIKLFRELNMMHKNILRLEEENKAMRRLLRWTNKIKLDY